jgi:propionyl-CoA carboxylase alpha chain
MEIKKILVANRGEIAIRVMRTAKDMGIKTVAIYSEADRNALHLRFADEAVLIGEAAPSSSYLNMAKIIEVALQLNVDAIHPGYGFLSENALFAQKVKEAKLIFIGPSADAIASMGSKLKAKETASLHQIPLVPGTATAISDIQEAKKIANDIGYPILIKASAGGGGKGMRLIDREIDFESEMKRAVSEAKAAFGDGSVFIEKYIRSPKHIEIQILGDQHGHVVHLFERECSIQRRHQKLVEEAPSAVLSPSIRKQMGDHAVKIAKACGYYGAGTVEFIMDENLHYYFLEMNTRLQVEHPVTELITGIDLVKEQIYIAEGKPLSFTQEDLKINGHAIELRVCAEDPLQNFLPHTGTITQYITPKGPGVRVDDGYENGQEVSIYYDPMIAKLICYGATRAEAIARMQRAIDEYQISGIATTLPFGKFVMQHEAFHSGKFDTQFIANYYHPNNRPVELSQDTEKIAVLMADLILNTNPVQQQDNQKTPVTNWGRRKDY